MKHGDVLLFDPKLQHSITEALYRRAPRLGTRPWRALLSFYLKEGHLKLAACHPPRRGAPALWERSIAPAPSSGRATRRTCCASVPRARDALDAAVERAPGVLSELAAERARLRRDVDAALAEHRRLSDELAKLAPSPPPVLR